MKKAAATRFEAFKARLEAYRVKRAELKAKHPDWSKVKIRHYAKHYVIGTSYVSAEHAHKLAVEGRQAYLRDKMITRGSVAE